MQPLALSQLLSVQGLPSSQPGPAPPVHLAPLHPSPAVQASPSSQALVLLMWVQPWTTWQPSLVQALSSSQDLATPGTQLPVLQMSPSVQTLPSEHLA